MQSLYQETMLHWLRIDLRVERESEYRGKLNIVAGNGYLGKKKKQYEESGIVITKNMLKLDSDDWNLDNIAERDIRVSDGCIKSSVEEME